MMTDDEIIEVVRAHKEGKQIQILGWSGKWLDDPNPTWSFLERQYRVKPEPRKPREGWVFTERIYDSVEKLASSNFDRIGEMIRVREVIE